ncbi:NfeD family protein [Motilibacter aurantiacus]|uniref:NfeD family protein n=1 Tax=Motilibacter aurantiacus TaxID=2714955 RepID=UPI00140DEEDE|nr:NfeD family protein [Motilibacter aurantiacus]NHC45401.1 NfeD family protein [Motilibacter aurantiacus]
MGWLGEHAWAAWLAVALLLVAVETLTLDLVALMLAAGAAAAAAAAAAGAPGAVQVLVACVSALAMLLVVRPVALRHLRPSSLTRTGIEALVGQQAVVLERTDGRGGRIKLAGEVWSARSYDPALVLEPGQTVDVMAVEGATAVVYGTGA